MKGWTSRSPLVAEEQHLVVDERLSQLGDGGVGQVVGEGDAADLRAERGPHRPGVEVLPLEARQAVSLRLEVPQGPDLGVVPGEAVAPGHQAGGRGRVAGPRLGGAFFDVAHRSPCEQVAPPA